MHQQSIVCVLFILSIFTIHTVFGENPIGDLNDECVLPLPRFSFFMPLVYTRAEELLPLENVENITLHGNQRVILSCYPGYFKRMPKEQVLSASCKSGELLMVNDVEKNWLKDLACEVRPIEEVVKPITGCPDNSESIEYGYSNPMKKESFVLGEACYSETEGRTIFIHTKVNGNRNVYLRTENENYFKQNHPSSSYKVQYLMALQLDTLNERLKNKLKIVDVPQLEFRHFIEANILQNKQFSSILKLSWNFVTANGFEKLSNWDLLLNDIQQATDDGKTFELYMGTHGILTLPDNDGKKTEIYLLDDEKRFPVPKYLWTIVKDDGKAVAFAILNNVRETEMVSDEENDICESKCTQIMWLTNLMKNNAYQNVKNGKIVCCNLEEFANVVSEVPNVVRQKIDLLI